MSLRVPPLLLLRPPAVSASGGNVAASAVAAAEAAAAAEEALQPTLCPGSVVRQDGRASQFRVQPVTLSMP